MDDSTKLFLVIALVMFGTFFLAILVVFVAVIRPWLRAFMSGAPIPMTAVVGMRLRNNPVTLLLDAYLTMRWKQIPVSIREVESCYMQHRNRITTADDLMEVVMQERGEK
ncbi:SigmaW regulon antibacterial [Maioricimonas rarisocia]|uniref:SigmaW regulon antibacterial n=1 Tax=Maioricimonas rarisocia TaxID=2528026 RepID=A0A517Z5D5_9PLAN|nr:hypothetical protein [Maioricimonas rarisocia]QDU37669.1 SigmaW regulon antibacterial [Maioricimonas rarisocia]